MQIAILGWGSLLWEDRPEFDQWHGSWRYDGPTLKLEFSRISKTRLRALTLVIDDEDGTPTQVAWCFSKRTNLRDAVCDLRTREGTTLNNIGQVVVASQADSATDRSVQGIILAWARDKKVEAVIWTALQSNFKQETGQSFSIETAVSHVKNLPSEGKKKAAEYVRRAPCFVKTPLREALQKERWFQEIGS